LERLDHGRIRLLAADPSSPPLLDFSSNDYLGLSLDQRLIAAGRDALARYGCGSGGARLMSGDLAIHHRLEEEIAALKNKEAALLFGSGYLANAGIIPALAGRHDVIFTDRLNHASIYDGCRLSGAEVVRFAHNDLTQLADLLARKRGANQALIVVESIYSMDGDRCPLRDLVALKERYGCLLLVDEAHATGIYGRNGGGVIEEEGISEQVDLAMGTFGKALGSYGAYVAASGKMIDYLLNRARSFIFSTALPPATVAASLAAIGIVRTQPEIRGELLEKVRFFKERLALGGFKELGPSQIVPLIIGEAGKALAAAEDLKREGLFVTAVRPPTVPEGSARLRLSITRHHSQEDLAMAADAIKGALKSPLLHG
jgi:glycine C-acetyltransferase/8-amino-7-oxononanoate synthase